PASTRTPDIFPGASDHSSYWPRIMGAQVWHAKAVLGSVAEFARIPGFLAPEFWRIPLPQPQRRSKAGGGTAWLPPSCDSSCRDAHLYPSLSRVPNARSAPENKLQFPAQGLGSPSTHTGFPKGGRMARLVLKGVLAVSLVAGVAVLLAGHQLYLIQTVV